MSSSSAGSVTSVFLIDDHPVVALGLKIALAGDPALKLVGTAPDLLQALAFIETSTPDCLILDLVFDGSIMLSNVLRARRALPNAAIIVYSSLPIRLYASDARAAGADAFLGKEADMSELAVLINRITASRTIAKAVIFDLPDVRNLSTIDGVHLTRREQDLVVAIGRGLSNEAIADHLALSPHTIAAHRENMRRKLGCRNSKELVARLATSIRSARAGN